MQGAGAFAPYTAMEPTETVTTEVTADATALMEALARIPRRPPVPAHPDTERRDQYAAALREHIKGLTFPAATPGGAPMSGATEYDLADVALMLADAETAQLRAERDAALRIATVWDDAPDPACRAMAADLRSTIRGARPSQTTGICETPHETLEDEDACERRRTAPAPEAATEATEPCGATTGMLDMYGRPVGPCTSAPHAPGSYHHDANGRQWAEYPTVGQLRDERDRYATALDKVRDFNKLVAEGSCRVDAAAQARDTLSILDRYARPSTVPPRPEKGQR
jgi:hypothetical protein